MDIRISEKTITAPKRSPWRLARLVFAFFMATFCFASEAHALFIDTGAFDFSCPAGGKANDDIDVTTLCPTTVAPGGTGSTSGTGNVGVFSHAMCVYEASVLEAMTRIECAMQNEMAGPAKLIFVLFFVLLGISFLTGIQNLTTKEAGIALFKVGLVWAFVSSASFSFEYGFKFFTGFASQGSALMMSIIDKKVDDPNADTGCAPAADDPNATKSERLMTSMDQRISGMSDFSMQDSTDETSPAATNQPCVTNGFNKIPDACRDFILKIVFFMTLLIPVLAGMIIHAVLKYTQLFARAMLGYLSAIFLLAFLFVLAPIFFSFLLFAPTRQLFDKWLEYLIAFALQMVIVFAFFAMINLFSVLPFIDQLAGLVQVDKHPPTGLGLLSYIPFLKATPCTLCDMNVTDNGVACKAAVGGEVPLLPLLDIIRRTDFITWLFVKFVSLVIVANVLEDFLERAPELARNLSSVRYAAILGGDETSLGPKFFGMKSFDTAIKGFQSGYNKASPMGGLFGFTPAAIRGGISEGVGSFFAGQKSPEWIKKAEELKTAKEEAVQELAKARAATQAQRVAVRAMEKNMPAEQVDSLVADQVAARIAAETSLQAAQANLEAAAPAQKAEAEAAVAAAQAEMETTQTNLEAVAPAEKIAADAKLATAQSSVITALREEKTAALAAVVAAEVALKSTKFAASDTAKEAVEAAKASLAAAQTAMKAGTPAEKAAAEVYLKAAQASLTAARQGDRASAEAAVAAAQAAMKTAKPENMPAAQAAVKAAQANLKTVTQKGKAPAATPALKDAQTKLKAAQQNEARQAAKVKTKETEIAKHEASAKTVSEGLMQEIEDINETGPSGALVRAAGQQAAQDRAAQNWYNILTDETGTPPPPESRADVSEIKDHATSMQQSIKSSPDYKNLAVADRNKLDGLLQNVQKASASGDADKLNKAIDEAQNAALTLGVTW